VRNATVFVCERAVSESELKKLGVDRDPEHGG
jgi:hypothetical protein